VGLVGAIHEREHLGLQVDVPTVNEKAVGGHVDYDPKLLALFATAGASEALARQETGWRQRLARINLAEIQSGLLGERYYIDPAETSPAAEALVPNVDPNVAQLTTFTLSGATAGAGYAVPLIEHLPPATVAPVNLDPVAQYRRARQSAKRASDDALDEIRRRLDKVKSEHAQSSPRDVLTFLADDLGVGQLTTARAVGVTPTAVRKWSRGDTAKPEHRGRLASFAAFCSLLMEMGLHDPAGWIDIPISDQSTLTPLDLFTAGQPDLAVLLGAGLADPQETLDAFDANWRESYAPDPDYEVIALADGTRSAVPRRGSHGT
jgi:hypothetical protein